MSFALTVGSDGQAATAQVVWSVNGQTYTFRSDNNFLSWITTIFTIADALSANAPDYRLLRPSPATNAGSFNGNTAAGTGAMANVDNSSTFNTAFGYFASNTNTLGVRNAAFGSNALQGNTGSDNTAVGCAALASAGSGSSNVAVGRNALTNNTLGNANVALGINALVSHQSGGNNIAIGADSLFANTNGNNNIAVGRDALKNANAPDSNIGIGTKAGETIVSGGSNIIIGHEANVDDSGRQRCIVLGRSAVSPASDGSLAIGGTGGNVMANLNVATAGAAAAGEYLNIYINGVQRKIALLLP